MEKTKPIANRTIAVYVINKPSRSEATSMVSKRILKPLKRTIVDSNSK